MSERRFSRKWKERIRFTSTEYMDAYLNALTLKEHAQQRSPLNKKISIYIVMQSQITSWRRKIERVGKNSFWTVL